ncbi:MAG: aspartate aminotransferase family protein [Acidobacteria bacterium]|nr:MAG: aspartate aminotransferase family protein [Acidobacteriota bacterium]
MDWENFRREAHALVDWLANYRQSIAERPVLARSQPGDIRAALPPHPPQRGEDFSAVLTDVDRIILPGITHWQSPNFFAYFPSNSSGASILGELLSAGLGVQGMLWATSPACTELETHVLDWLVEMLALPEAFRSTSAGGGVIQDTASSSALCALLAARERATAGSGNQKGLGEAGTRLTAYASTQAHSSVEKAVTIAGLGREHLRLIPVDKDFALDPAALEAQITADQQAGFQPCFVAATIGTTSSNAMDPLAAIGRIARQHGLWLHVDAAMSGTAALCPEFRRWFTGLDLADSYNFNPHKWMFTTFDCSCLWVRERAALIAALSILPEYLRNAASASGAVIDYRDWQIPLGRRFRALKLWFVIRAYGVEGLRQAVRRHVTLAQEFARWVRSDPHFELAAPAPLNLVCFRLRGSDEVNEKLLQRLNASGALFLTHTKLNGRYVLRMCIGQMETEEKHVTAAWRRIQEEGGRLA